MKTIFAEYLFPVVAHSRDGTAVDATETVRVAAKPADNGKPRNFPFVGQNCQCTILLLCIVSFCC